MRTGLAALMVALAAVPGFAQQPVAASPNGMAAGSQAGEAHPYAGLYASMSGSGVYGQVPVVYRILGLSAEQTAKLEEINAAASSEYLSVRAQRPPMKEHSADALRAYYAESAAKRKAIGEKYAAQMREALNDEQRALLARIEEAVKAKTDSDQQAMEALTRARKESMAALETGLDQILTAEQKAKLREAAMVKPALPMSSAPVRPMPR